MKQDIAQDRLIKDLKVTGCMFESLCLRDLKIYSESIGAKVFHYRDDSDTEVDAIIEMADGTWGAFEIKLGHNQVEKAVENLLRFKERMLKHDADRAPSVLCVICGMTKFAYRTEQGVYVVPITTLGP